MNLITIPVTSLAVSAPPGSHITADELASYFTASDIIAQAEQRALAIQQEAQQHLEQVEQQCQQAYQQAYQEGMDQLQNEAPTIRQQLAADTIEWLIAEHQLEQEIVNRLESRLRELLSTVFNEFITDQNAIDLLAQRLTQRLDMLSHEETATLHVSPEQNEGLTQAFADYPWLQVKSDAAMLPGEALLSSSLFSLYLNLEEQLQSILARLQTLAPETENNYED